MEKEKINQTEEKKKRASMLRYRIKQSKGFIKYHRESINSHEKELDFIRGKRYDKSWEEEYANGVEENNK